MDNKDTSPKNSPYRNNINSNNNYYKSSSPITGEKYPGSPYEFKVYNKDSNFPLSNNNSYQVNFNMNDNNIFQAINLKNNRSLIQQQYKQQLDYQVIR